MTINPQPMVGFGIASNEASGAAVWADPLGHTGALAFGGAAPSHADVLFSRLARLSDEPGANTESGYPPRVIKCASVLETLHRELWHVREQGHSAMALGVGVVVVADDQVYFLQIGPVQLLHVNGGTLREIAGVAQSAPLLGTELKSAIGVFTLTLAMGDRVVARVVDPRSAAPDAALASAIAAPRSSEEIANGVIAASPQTGGVLALMAMPPASLEPPPLAEPAPEAAAPESVALPAPQATAPSATDPAWSFEEDVVDDLSSYISELSPPETDDEEPAIETHAPFAGEEVDATGGGVSFDDASDANGIDEPDIVPPALGSGQSRFAGGEDDTGSVLEGAADPIGTGGRAGDEPADPTPIEHFPAGPEPEHDEASIMTGASSVAEDVAEPALGSRWAEESAAALDAVAAGLEPAGERDEPAHAGAGGAPDERGLGAEAEMTGVSAAAPAATPIAEPPDPVPARQVSTIGTSLSFDARTDPPADSRSQRSSTSYGKAVGTVLLVAAVIAGVALRVDRIVIERWGHLIPALVERSEKGRTVVAERERRPPSDAAPKRVSPPPVAASPSPVLDPDPVLQPEPEPATNPPSEISSGARASPTGEGTGSVSEGPGHAPRATAPAGSDPPAKSEAPVPEGAPGSSAGTPAEAVLDELPELFVVSVLGPHGGVIEIDGEQLVQKTPANEIVLDAGVHSLSVDYGRLGVWRSEVDVDREAMRIDATPRGHLRIDASASAGRVEVLVDGASLGKRPPAFHAVAAGEHRIAFEGPGVSGVESVILVGVNDTTLVSVPSGPVGEALIVVTSRRFEQDHFEDADGDSIFVDRVFAGMTPREVTVTPGTHGVRVVSTDGNDQVTRIVALPSGAIRVVRADFGGERRLAFAHRPYREARIGDPLLLPVLILSDAAPEAESVGCHFRIDGLEFTERAMKKVQDGTAYWVLSISRQETLGHLLEYYFAARDRDGVEIVSEIYRVPLGDITTEPLADSS